MWVCISLVRPQEIFCTIFFFFFFFWGGWFGFLFNVPVNNCSVFGTEPLLPGYLPLLPKLYGFSTKIYDKRDDFNFDIVNFPFLNGDVPQRPSYGVYISQLIRFARASSHVTDFNNRNKFLTAKLLKQGYRYHKLRKAFSKFYRRHFELVEKYHVSLKKTYATRYL